MEQILKYLHASNWCVHVVRHSLFFYVLSLSRSPSGCFGILSHVSCLSAPTEFPYEYFYLSLSLSLSPFALTLRPYTHFPSRFGWSLCSNALLVWASGSSTIYLFIYTGFIRSPLSCSVKRSICILSALDKRVVWPKAVSAFHDVPTNLDKMNEKKKKLMCFAQFRVIGKIALHMCRIHLNFTDDESHFRSRRISLSHRLCHCSSTFKHGTRCGNVIRTFISCDSEFWAMVGHVLHMNRKNVELHLIFFNSRFINEPVKSLPPLLRLLYSP